ncbi:MAG: hypothetical protein CMI52_04190 [Parcubacteria group bacterium]|nr:hypothetical protein [Parcubacteria group bacterium]|tara:strand:+ start:88 stop:345 length:258 start_codon:yes stop_codon:yes gene_type:complete
MQNFEIPSDKQEKKPTQETQASPEQLDIAFKELTSDVTEIQNMQPEQRRDFIDRLQNNLQGIATTPGTIAIALLSTLEHLFTDKQ